MSAAKRRAGRGRLRAKRAYRRLPVTARYGCTPCYRHPSPNARRRRERALSVRAHAPSGEGQVPNTNGPGGECPPARVGALFLRLGHPVTRLSRLPAIRRTSSAARRSPCYPFTWPTSGPANRPTGQPGNRATGQPGNRPTGQPANRPTGQPADRVLPMWSLRRHLVVIPCSPEDAPGANARPSCQSPAYRAARVDA